MVPRLVPRLPWRHSISNSNKLSFAGHSVTRLRYVATASAQRLCQTNFCLTASYGKIPRRLNRSYNNSGYRLLSTTQEPTPKTPMRKNKVDVQMLNSDLHRRVFPSPLSTSMQSIPEPSMTNLEPTPEMIHYSIKHLQKQNLWGKKGIPAPDISFPVPPLRGQNIEDHFYNIGVHESATYMEIANKFAQSDTHPPPKKWEFKAGWTRYGKDGTIKQVDYPEESALTFDVETVPILSKYPVMACAMSKDAWYGWVSPWLIDPTVDGKQNDKHLMSFGPNSDKKHYEKVLIGHNVGYDRARILEEYSLEPNGIRYLDTMSLHIAVSGLCTQQRPSWMKYFKAMESEDVAYLKMFKDTTGKYFDVSSVNSLLQVAKFHCGIRMNKEARNILVEADNMDLIQENFQRLMSYCGEDVAATHSVYQKTFPKYLEKCPHPVSFAGILQMGSSFLTVNEGWKKYISRCNKMYEEVSQEIESKLHSLAEDALERFGKDPTFYESDPWLSQLNWDVPTQPVWFEGKMRVDGKGWVKGGEPKFKGGKKILPDKPEWYRALWNPEEARVKLTTRQKIAPILLKLQWLGFPLVHSSEFGWTYRVPRDSEYTTKKPELEFPKENEAGYQAKFNTELYKYYRVPHSSGEDTNVGSPLSKGFTAYFEDNVLSCYAPEGVPDDGTSELAKQAIKMNGQCAYWVSARERIEGQFVVWDRDMDENVHSMGLPDRGEDKSSGIILPQIITMGTVTRRAVEKTWMTASNAKKNRIGSELKSMIEAPAGYKIVGADVDSEELWISSLMGDAQFRMHGATALGWMTLQGTKSDGTDLHSKSAKILGITRDQAKIFNYGRIYGAGVKFAARLMQQFNTTIEALEAKQRATELYTATKGIKQQRASNYELVSDRPFWHGGSESYMFNSLERTATAEDPRTPVLGCGITDALKPKYTEAQFMTSRINWVVQSSGVDYLHMLLVSMNYLIRKYDIKARFMLCVHDEVRYMVKEEDSARATLALQVSNLWTRAMFSYKLGIHDLPQSVAFFSSVDVDHVFRKEVNMDCITPTQHSAIEHGTSLTIEDVLKLTEGGDLGKVAEGYQDASDGRTPDDLRSLSYQGRGGIRSDKRGLYLEAQGLGSLPEIKKAIGRRAAETKAAMEAVKDDFLVTAATRTKIQRTDTKSNRPVTVLPEYRNSFASTLTPWGSVMEQSDSKSSSSTSSSTAEDNKTPKKTVC